MNIFDQLYYLDDYYEDITALLEPVFSLEPDEWLTLDVESMALD